MVLGGGNCCPPAHAHLGRRAAAAQREFHTARAGIDAQPRMHVLGFMKLVAISERTTWCVSDQVTHVVSAKYGL